MREIGEAVGLYSSSTVWCHLEALEANGYIRRTPGKPRSIEIVETSAYWVTTLQGSPEQFQALLDLIPDALEVFRAPILRLIQRSLS